MVRRAARIAPSLAGKISSPLDRTSTRLPPAMALPVCASMVAANAPSPAAMPGSFSAGGRRWHDAAASMTAMTAASREAARVILRWIITVLALGVPATGRLRYHPGMTTLTVEHPEELLQHIGRELGPSEWMTVEQAMIDKFADATGDHQWIHVDVERAKRDMPGGRTIAHGYLTLSLVPRLAATLVKVTKRRHGLNYGSNKVRFTNAVPAGARIRLRQRLANVERVAGNGVRVTSEMTVEIEGQERPALVAELISVQYA